MNNKRNVMLTIAALVVLFGLACFVQAEVDSYIRRIVNLCLIYAIIGLSMNVTNGFAGQFSLGQAGFMAIGAYMVGIFTVPVELRADVFYAIPMNPHLVNIYMPLGVALFLGGVLAAMVAGLIGTPVLRLRGDYLAIATLGFSEIIRIIITNATSITNGALGIKNIPPLNDVRYIFLATAISYVLITLLLNSSYGRAFKAIRDDEVAAEAMGINLAHHKQLAFCISSFFAGVGGAMLAMYQTTVQAKSFTSAMTYEILLIVVIGGVGSVTGSVLSSFLFVACSEWWLRFLDEKQMIGSFEVPFLRNGFRLVVFSVIIMIVVLFFRRGIMGDRELWDFGAGGKAERRAKQ